MTKRWEQGEYVLPGHPASGKLYTNIILPSLEIANPGTCLSGLTDFSAQPLSSFIIHLVNRPYSPSPPPPIMSSIKPHILFVTGAWHDTAYLGATCNKLIEKGYPVICPLLPSFAAAPHVSMHDDAAHIRTLIDGCIRQGGEILVVAHSYGGVVATQAILPCHSRRARSIAGLPGGVVRILFVGGFMLVPGQSLTTALSGGMMPAWTPLLVSAPECLG